MSDEDDFFLPLIMGSSLDNWHYHIYHSNDFQLYFGSKETIYIFHIFIFSYFLIKTLELYSIAIYSYC